MACEVVGLFFLFVACLENQEYSGVFSVRAFKFKGASFQLECS